MSDGWAEYREFRRRKAIKAQPADGFYSFVSYSRRDDEYGVIQPFVRDYIDLMRSHIDYIPVFIDYFYFGDEQVENLYDRLGESILKSDFTTAFISPGYACSPWCNFEWWESIRMSKESSSDDLNFKRSQARNHTQHRVLPFVWKELAPRDESAFGGSFQCVSLVSEFCRSDWRLALEKAVATTLRFIRETYGVNFEEVS
jgi:hypothetical protein